MPTEIYHSLTVPDATWRAFGGNAMRMREVLALAANSIVSLSQVLRGSERKEVITPSETRREEEPRGRQRETNPDFAKMKRALDLNGFRVLRAPGLLTQLEHEQPCLPCNLMFAESVALSEGHFARFRCDDGGIRNKVVCPGHVELVKQLYLDSLESDD